jgi:hypothetical protein
MSTNQLTMLSDTEIYVKVLPVDFCKCSDFRMAVSHWDNDARIACSEKMKDGQLMFKGNIVLKGEKVADYK